MKTRRARHAKRDASPKLRLQYNRFGSSYPWEIWHGRILVGSYQSKSEALESFDLVRKELKRRTSSRPPARDKRAPRIGRAKREWISAKIRVLRHEGYPEKQAIAIAHRMAGVPRPGAR